MFFSIGIVARAADAQPTLSNGIQSLVRGDYETAVSLLRPLAEAAAQPHPLAQFFMAMLYDSGRGVSRDQSRACALYLVAATPANPLMNQALDLARSIQERYSTGPGGARICVSADTSPRQDLPTAPFVSGSGHSVVDATRTTDGVDAFVHGDYRLAAEILKAASEQAWHPDHTAEFFMATLYTNGVGVPVDQIRGCALYLRASTDRTGSPFATAADGLIRMLQGALGRDAFQDCSWRASVGFDHKFQPVTFPLEPGHWIAFDLKGAAITYHGTERRVQTRLVTNRSVFFRIQHTELAMGPPPSGRRHFIEVLRWLPSTDADRWTLMWNLSEVVRDRLIPITSQDLVTVAAHEAPADVSIEVLESVRLIVNESGVPEWTVLTGSSRRTGIIERRFQNH